MLRTSWLDSAIESSVDISQIIHDPLRNWPMILHRPIPDMANMASHPGPLIMSMGIDQPLVSGTVNSVGVWGLLMELPGDV